VTKKPVAPLQVGDHVDALSGGLRYAVTTGYYLTAFQAEPSPSAEASKHKQQPLRSAPVCVKLQRMSSNKSPVTQFREVLETQAPTYGVTLTTGDLDGLSEYYRILNVWNDRLHLVAPSPPRVFATRHVLESLLLLNYLPQGARIADIGSGAGLPIVPCLILRPDIHAVLIEASKKKAIFLREALNATKTSARASVIAERFENVEPPEVDFITSRALERFEAMLPKLFSWAPSASRLLLFAGEGLGHKIEESGFAYTRNLIPKSQRRFLFEVRKP
jgi:16S rRNA (guanine(527)-N(7))-methyltransferase RsmG